jgi:CheY-like chemotaxis protein
MKVRNHILVVEDEPAQRYILQRTLSKIDDGCQVEVAANGEEALDKVRETSFDLILTDLGMPKMGGVAFTEAIRDLAPRTIVVWITAYDCYLFESEAERLDVQCCLDKPLRVEQIRETVRQCLSAHQNIRDRNGTVR